jgi:hypothetical protein
VPRNRKMEIWGTDFASQDAGKACDTEKSGNTSRELDPARFSGHLLCSSLPVLSVGNGFTTVTWPYDSR